MQVLGSYASRHRDQVHALDMLAADVSGLRRVITDVVDLDGAPDVDFSVYRRGPGDGAEEER